MVCKEVKIVEGNYDKDGYSILRNKKLSLEIKNIKEEFKFFHSKFDKDASKNRNILKRFSDTFKVSNIFSNEIMYLILKTFINIKNPIFCGPVVSHYTSNDKTGSSYGLPFHQDYPSMASSKNSCIIWFCLEDCSTKNHSIAVIPGLHKNGLLPGDQNDGGYVLNLLEKDKEKEKILDIIAGDILIMSSFLPHKTYVNKMTKNFKLSFSRRIDDFENQDWAHRKFVNAYKTIVDRQLFRLSS